MLTSALLHFPRAERLSSEASPDAATLTLDLGRIKFRRGSAGCRNIVPCRSTFSRPRQPARRRGRGRPSADAAVGPCRACRVGSSRSAATERRRAVGVFGGKGPPSARIASFPVVLRGQRARSAARMLSGGAPWCRLAVSESNMPRPPGRFRGMPRRVTPRQLLTGQLRRARILQPQRRSLGTRQSLLCAE